MGGIRRPGAASRRDPGFEVGGRRGPSGSGELRRRGEPLQHLAQCPQLREVWGSPARDAGERAVGGPWHV